MVRIEVINKDTGKIIYTGTCSDEDKYELLNLVEGMLDILLVNNVDIQVRTI